MGFVTKLNPHKPKSNLTDAEQRGKGWILKSIRQQKIFVTSADKGGATLILDYTTVMDTVRSELEKKTKFTKLETSVETKMEQTQQKVKDAVLKHHTLTPFQRKIKSELRESTTREVWFTPPNFDPRYHTHTHCIRFTNYFRNK